MKKLNLVLMAIAFIMLIGVVSSFSVALAEDQQMVMQKMDKDNMRPCGDPNCGTDKPCKCGDGCQCPAAKMARDRGNNGMGMGVARPMMKDNMGDQKGMDMKKMDMMKMDMGKGMPCQCQMMDKMKGDMPMGNMQMGNMQMGNMQMKSPDMMAYIEKLQLTQEQRDRIDSAKIAHQKDMIRKNADRDIAQIELDEMMRKDEPNLTAISDQLKKIADIEADLKFAQIKVMVDIKSILTKEQKDNLKMMMEHDRMDMPMGKMEQRGMQQPPAPGQPDKPTPEPMKDMKMK